MAHVADDMSWVVVPSAAKCHIKTGTHWSFRMADVLPIGFEIPYDSAHCPAVTSNPLVNCLHCITGHFFDGGQSLSMLSIAEPEACFFLDLFSTRVILTGHVPVLPYLSE